MPCARGLEQQCVASAVKAQHARDVLAFRTHRVLASVKANQAGVEHVAGAISSKTKSVTYPFSSIGG